MYPSDRYCGIRRKASVMVLMIVSWMSLLGWPAGHAQAQTYDVCSSGCRYASIQAAIDAANSGSLITIGPGTYRETIRLRPRISLRGHSPETTLIQGNGQLPVIKATGSDIQRTVIVEKLAVTGGGGPKGGGILVQEGASPTFRTIAIYNNSAIHGGGGVAVTTDGNALFEDVRVAGNTSRAGAGVSVDHGRVTLRNTIVENNRVVDQADAGALHVTANSVLTMENVIVRGSTAMFGGGMRLSAGSTAQITGGRFENNRAIENGGAISVSNQAHLTLNGTVIANNQAKIGGGIAVADSTLTVADCRFEHNRAEASAGAIQANSGTQLIVRSSRFDGNQAATINAGAILLVEIGGELRNNVFTDNEAARVGGAIHLDNAHNPLLENNQVTNNRSKDGAGVHMIGGEARLIRNIINDNAATGFGGGVVATRMNTVTLRDNRIERNTAGIDAGGIAFQRGSGGTLIGNVISFNDAGSVGGGMTIFDDASPTLRGNRFEGNTAIDDGGAIQIELNAAPVIESNDFVANVAHRYGGAVVVNLASTPTLRANTFAGNRADQNGGAIFINSGSRALVERNDINHNLAEGVGGGLIVLSDDNSTISGNYVTYNRSIGHGAGVYVSNSTAKLSENQILHNQSGGLGGGVVIQNASPTLANNLIAENRSVSSGDGLYLSDSSAMVVNNTLADNDSGQDGDGVFLNSSPGTTFSNNLIVGNAYGLRTNGSQPQLLTRNCVYGNHQANYSGITPGPDDFIADPLLTRGVQGTYYLAQSSAGQSQTSPLVDAASQSAEALGLDQSTTRTDGQFDRGRADIGFHYSRPLRHNKYFPLAPTSH